MFKPMLAATMEDAEKLNYPLMASPKLDGIRCLIINGTAVSRNMKGIPNRHIWDSLAGLPPLDGELIVGPATAPDCFNKSTSGVMRQTGEPKFKLYVFDHFGNPHAGFRQRLTIASGTVRDLVPHGAPLVLVKHKDIRDPEQLLAYEQEQLALGYEGVMLRHPAGLYKNGRSTLREGLLMKLKRFADGEAEVIGFVERQHNANEQTRDELGRAKRSSAKSGKRGTGTLGALQVRDRDTGVEFEIGTGFDDALRQRIWNAQRDWAGKLIKYKHQPVGAVDKPRFPVYLGERSLADL